MTKFAKIAAAVFVVLGGLAFATVANANVAASAIYTPATGFLRMGSGMGARVAQAPQVMAAQTALNACVPGTALVIDGKMGPLTTAKFQAFQASKGIAVDGIIGPITAAQLSACSGTTTPTTPSTGSTTLNGGAGDLNISSTSVDTEDEVAEGTTEKVLAFRAEAEDSDIQVTNMRVIVENNDAPTSNRRPDRYLSEIVIKMGNKTVGTIDPTDMTRDGNVYSRNVSLNGAIIEEGLANRETFYVEFKALANIDSLDMQSASFSVDVENIRFVDGTGAIMTSSQSASVSGITFTDPASQGDVRMRISLGNTPEEGSVQVNEFSSTNNVNLLEFKLKAEGLDMTVEEIHVEMFSGTEDLCDIVSDVRLVRGSTTLADVSSIACSDSDIVEFELYDDMVIEEGDSETLKVVAKLFKQDGNFNDGETLRAEFDAFIAEDDNGNAVTNSIGSANGYTQTLFVNGATITFVSSNSQATNQDNTSRDYTIVFDVTAIGNDLQVNRTLFNSTGVQYAFADGDTNATTGITATLSSTASLNAGIYTVSEGQTRRFTLTVNANASAGATTGLKKLQVTGVAGIAPATLVEGTAATLN